MLWQWHPDVLALAEEWNEQSASQKFFWLFIFELATCFEKYTDNEDIQLSKKDISPGSVHLCLELANRFGIRMPPRRLLTIDWSLLDKFDTSLDFQDAWERVVEGGRWKLCEINEMISQWQRFLKIFGFLQLGLEQGYPKSYRWGEFREYLSYGRRLYIPAVSNEDSELIDQEDNSVEPETKATQKQKKITTWLYASTASPDESPRLTIAERDALLKKLRRMEKQSERNLHWVDMLEDHLGGLEMRPDKSTVARTIIQNTYHRCEGTIPVFISDREALEQFYQDSSFFHEMIRSHERFASRFEDYVGMLERHLVLWMPVHYHADQGDWRLFVNLDGKGLATRDGIDEDLYEGSSGDVMDVDHV